MGTADTLFAKNVKKPNDSMQLQSDNLSCKLQALIIDNSDCQCAYAFASKPKKESLLWVFDATQAYRSLQCSSHMEFRAGNHVIPPRPPKYLTDFGDNQWTYNYKMRDQLGQSTCPARVAHKA